MAVPRMFFGERALSVWLVIITTLALLALAAFAYLVARLHRFSLIKRLDNRSRLLSWLAAFLPVAALGLFARVSITAVFVVALHLMAAFLLCDLAALLIGRLTKRPVSADVPGLTALALTAVYLSLGWFMAHHVFETDYRVQSAKVLSHDTRIVLVADAHLGVTLDGEDFSREMEKVQALEADAVVIVGDFVDDSSRAADMIAACRALGELKAPVYYVWGNHDKGYSRGRDFDAQTLRGELEKNGVVILEDESVPLDDSLYLVGRRDRSDRGRADIQSLVQELDSSKYMLVLDHQPNDYAAEAEACVDMVLSGHTHGGHIFPAGQIGLLMGANDALYGYERRGNTDFIVTSGISGWAIPFKTGCRSEIAVIDLISA